MDKNKYTFEELKARVESLSNYLIGYQATNGYRVDINVKTPGYGGGPYTNISIDL